MLLQDFKHCRKTNNGLPERSQMEAHTLEHVIHLEMLKHQSPRQALENRPSNEISLWRLFAILYVEEAVNTGKFKERTSAWHYVHLLHDCAPRHSHIRPHRRRDDLQDLPREGEHRGHQGNRRSQSEQTFKHTERTQQESAPKLAPKQVGQSRQTGETGLPVTIFPSSPPSSNSSTFPIPPH